jgi:glycosyltransferase involved in cell wall biosynthesis
MGERGIKVFALAPDYDEHWKGEMIKMGAEPFEINWNRTGRNIFREMFSLFKLVKLLKKLKPDSSFSYFLKPAILGNLASWFARIPNRYVMIEGLGIVFVKQSFLQLVIKKLYKFSLSKAKKVIFLNRDDLNDFMNWKLVPQQKTEYLGPIGIDLQYWTASDVSFSPFTFLFVGRLMKEKGILDFCQASEIVKRKYPNTEFIVLGTFPAHEKKLEGQVNKFIKSGIILWQGFQEVLPYLRKSTVFVLPTYYREGSPRSIQEAMGAGRAVITTNVPGCRELITNGVNGILIPPRDTNQLADAMIYCLKNPGEVIRMGKEARKFAENNLDQEMINERLMNMMME